MFDSLDDTCCVHSVDEGGTNNACARVHFWHSDQQHMLGSQLDGCLKLTELLSTRLDCCVHAQGMEAGWLGSPQAHSAGFDS